MVVVSEVAFLGFCVAHCRKCQLQQLQRLGSRLGNKIFHVSSQVLRYGKYASKKQVNFINIVSYK
jgi:hypothetical protein